MIYIGVDTGVHTGLAVWDSHDRQFLMVDTLPIHIALEVVTYYQKQTPDLLVIFEDARQRKWYTGDVSAKAQGAGSVKRDAKIWQDFLEDKGIRFQMVAPQKGLSKWDAETFKHMTGWKARTSNHARDAALLVWGK